MTIKKQVLGIRPLKIFAIALIFVTVVYWLQLRPYTDVDFDAHFTFSLLLLSAALLCFALDILTVYLVMSRRQLFALQFVAVALITLFLYAFAF